MPSLEEDDAPGTEYWTVRPETLMRAYRVAYLAKIYAIRLDAVIAERDAIERFLAEMQAHFPNEPL